MPAPKKEHPKEKIVLHPRNKHRERYDFKALIAVYPALGTFVKLNDYGDESIDFFDPIAVMNLNKALLKAFYHIDFWEIPKGYLCPPIPGRADYLHYVADLLAADNHHIVPRGFHVSCLDIGVGANGIYPIIGTTEYGWSFVGADIDAVSIASVAKIVEMNPVLKKRIQVRLQPDPKQIFQDIIKPGELFDVTICNPPFHASAEEAASGTLRKLSNLKGKRINKPVLNFGGKSNELWCKGGEERFVNDMISESKRFQASCLWFTTLLSKQSNVDATMRAIKKAGALEVQSIPMTQGNKSSRIVAWTFFDVKQRGKWIDSRWNPGD